MTSIHSSDEPHVLRTLFRLKGCWTKRVFCSVWPRQKTPFFNSSSFFWEVWQPHKNHARRWNLRYEKRLSMTFDRNRQSTAKSFHGFHEKFHDFHEPPVRFFLFPWSFHETLPFPMNFPWTFHETVKFSMNFPWKYVFPLKNTFLFFFPMNQKKSFMEVMESGNVVFHDMKKWFPWKISFMEEKEYLRGYGGNSFTKKL